MTLPNNAASEVFDPPLDPGIAAAVIMLRAGGVETFFKLDRTRGQFEIATE